MGQRGELFSNRLFIDEGQKTYFFNVKENRTLDRYINIVESRKSERGYKRSSLVVFDVDVDKFLASLGQAMGMIKSRKPMTEHTLTVGGGRREYVFRLPPKGKPALQLTEKRDDATGTYRESIIIPIPSFEVFTESLNKAVEVLKRK